MSGVLFVVTIPSSEEQLQLKIKKSEIITKSRSADGISRKDSSHRLLQKSQSECGISEASSVERPQFHINGEDIEKSMEENLENILNKMILVNAVWSDRKARYIQVTFMVSGRESCEDILQQLRTYGIGSDFNSTISILPCTLCYQGLEGHETSPILNEPRTLRSTEQRKTDTMWTKFMTSVRARLTVAQVVERVKGEANLTFDFVMFTLIASIISALGLVEDSTVILVASMLVSPLMGPIMAGTFGAVIGDRHLQKIGVRNEMIGILITIIVGFVYGLIVGVCIQDGQWVTHEMESRGEFRSLWVGSLVAIASGAAAAVAILSDNTASLVGVAISASLLPTAVNAGLLWSLACMALIWPPTSPSETPFDASYPVNLVIMGAVSLCLTFINVIFIFLAGILFLKIKEVAPINSPAHKQFWDHDIKIVRDYNKTLHGEEADRVSQQFHDVDEKEFKRWNCMLSNAQFQSRLGMASRHMTWSPGLEHFGTQPLYQTLSGQPRWSFDNGAEAPYSPPQLLVHVPEERKSALSVIPETTTSQQPSKQRFLVTPVDNGTT